MEGLVTTWRLGDDSRNPTPFVRQEVETSASSTLCEHLLHSCAGPEVKHILSESGRPVSLTVFLLLQLT